MRPVRAYGYLTEQNVFIEEERNKAREKKKRAMNETEMQEKKGA